METTHERLEGGIVCQVQVDLAQMNASGNGGIVDTVESEVAAVLSISGCEESDSLGDGAVVVHGEEGLELLDDASMGSEHIVLHVSLGHDELLLLDMVDNFELVAALIAALESVVEDVALEPVGVVEHVLLVVVGVLELGSEEVGLVELGVVDDDVPGVIGDLDRRVMLEFVLFMGMLLYVMLKLKSYYKVTNKYQG